MVGLKHPPKRFLSVFKGIKNQFVSLKIPKRYLEKECENAPKEKKHEN